MTKCLPSEEMLLLPGPVIEKHLPFEMEQLGVRVPHKDLPTPI